MNEQEMMKKSLIKNMMINFVVFTILFVIFDFIIYNQISLSLYQSVDEELIKEQEQYETRMNNTTDFINRKNNVPGGSEEEKAKENKLLRMNGYINPRFMNIIRDTNGNIINEESLGRLYSEYGQDISFDKNNLFKIYAVVLNGEYTYRGISFEITKEGEKAYVQLLANVDGETQTLKNVSQTLLIGTAILITISIIASYMLSKKTMKPIFESYKKQTEFVQNASHELRTPLTIIQAKQELLLQEPNSKIIDKSEDINLTLKETKRLSKMIKELMDLARADSNEYELKKENIKLDELIKEVVVPYMDYAKIEEKTIILELEYQKEIKLDRNKINQLLIILLDNAIKYTMQNDTITIKTYYKEGKCNIEIKDTGIGISDEGLKHVFDRFYREDKARSRQTGGTGLGLSIAHTIVTTHGGIIKAMHNQPKGTIILIKI